MDLSDSVTEKIELRLNGEAVNAQVDFHRYREEKVFQIEDNLIVTFFDPINYEMPNLNYIYNLRMKNKLNLRFHLHLKRNCESKDL